MNSIIIKDDPKKKVDTLTRLNKHRIPERKWKTTKMGLSADQAICIHYDVPSRIRN